MPAPSQAPGRPPRPARSAIPGVSAVLILACAALLRAAPPATNPPARLPPHWRFTEVSGPAGVACRHAYLSPPNREAPRIAGGVAAGDYDGDGFIDLYAVAGDAGPNLLLRNQGDGTFREVGAAAGVDLVQGVGSGPVFADVDGDGGIDLLAGGLSGTPVRLFRNRRNGTFEEVTPSSGLQDAPDAYSAALGDYDRDGDLDLAMTRWIAERGRTGYLWRNDGGGRFTDVGAVAAPALTSILDFTPNFADLDSDGWPDLLVAADFGTSRVLRNLGNGAFADITTPAISDENGMGAAVGDYDNDGDLDWFVTSIHDPNGVAEGNWGITGNRLYRNRGDGYFDDVTGEAGVREGFWGWGACFADFDNDGNLDLFHVNGFSISEAREFFADPARLFVSGGDGRFVERAAGLGVADTGDGRGVVCFDYDRDGDIDLFIANNQGPSRLYRNDGLRGRHWLAVRLRGLPPNTEAIGARVHVVAGGVTRMREIRAGSNFESQDPAEAHFGLGPAPVVESVRVTWPDGATTSLGRMRADRLLTIRHPLKPE